MAEKKFSELTAKGAALADTDLLAISEDAGGGAYTSKSVTGANVKALVTDANMTTTDITTNDVSTSKHGFAPKAPNDTTKFLRGDGTWAVPASGGLTKFTEAENTSAPNGTVYVDSLTAAASSTNADFAIVPKGSGSIMFGVPNNATSGGNKRGANSVDLQKYRTAADQVVGGDGSSQVGAENKTVGAFSGTYGNANANNVNYTHVLGRSNTANGGSSILVGQFNSNSGTSCGAFGHNNSLANDNQYAFGAYNSLANQNSIAIGRSCSDNGTNGRIVMGIAAFVAGDTQKSIFSLSKRTTDATQTTLTLAASPYQGPTSVRIADNSAYRFKGTIIGKQSGSTNAAAWDIDGLIVRGVGVGATSLVLSNINLVQNTPAWGTPVLSADTTQGCLKVDVIGKAATNIQWTAMIETTEVIYA